MREKKELNVRIGVRVKGAREAARLTQEQLAERIEVTPQYVSDLERGAVGLSVATLRRLCQSLGVSSDAILFEQAQVNGMPAVFERCMRLPEDKYEIACEMMRLYIEAVGTGRED